MRSNPSAPAIAMGIIVAGSAYGAVAGPLLFGWLVEAGRINAAWVSAALTFALGAAVFACVDRRTR